MGIFEKLDEHGVRYTINTDGTYYCKTNLRREFAILTDAGILTPERAEQIRVEAFTASFGVKMALTKAQITACAAELGFNRVRFAMVEPNVALKEYDRFLANGFHGDMKWMVRSPPTEGKYT